MQIASPTTSGLGVSGLGWVEVPAGIYLLGERGEERPVRLRAFRIGRFPVTEADVASFAADRAGSAPRAGPGEPVASHPATGLTYSDVQAFCTWAGPQLGHPVRLPTGDEWEATARGDDGRDWPWGNTFDPERCACVESAWGWTVPVDAHPGGASPFGAEQMAGNVWEWVTDLTEDGAWRAVRGGSHLDHAWGVRCARVLSADPDLATRTTGFRLVADR